MSKNSLQFITFNDVHISAINPQSRTGDYCEDIFDKLDQIRKVGTKLDVDFFLFAGDLFNLKAPMRNPHRLNSRLIQLFKSFPGPVYAIEGNHDLRFDSYDTFNEQPLDVIYSSGALIQLREHYIDKNGIRIYLKGYPFSESIEGMEPIDKDDFDISICLLHVYSSLKGGNLFRNKIYSYEEISQLGYDMYVLGHYHIDQGITTHAFNTKERTFINIGAISRGSLDEDNIDRSPKFGLIKVIKSDEGLKIDSKAVRLKVRPYDQVFDVVKKEEDKKRQVETEEFVGHLKNEISENINDENKVEKEIDAMKIDKEIIDKVRYFLQEADLVLKGIT